MINAGTATVQLSFPLKLRRASRGLLPPAFGGCVFRGGVYTRASQSTIGVAPGTNVSLKVFCRICISSVITVLTRMVAFQGRPRLLLQDWLMPYKVRSHRIARVGYNIRECLAILLASGSARFPQLREVPTSSLSCGSCARASIFVLLFRGQGCTFAMEDTLQQRGGWHSIAASRN
jgi:hypothetical protein